MSNPIDYALAIWMINPQMEYLLDDSANPTCIVEWRGPGPEPTQQELYAAWLKCTRFEVDEAHATDEHRTEGAIQADGVDTATVTVRTGEQENSLDVLVRDQVLSVPVSEGLGTLEIIASTPTVEPHIIVRAEDQQVYGDHQIRIKAV